jgi:hypothetical protein
MTAVFPANLDMVFFSFYFRAMVTYIFLLEKNRVTGQLFGW